MLNFAINLLHIKKWTIIRPEVLLVLSILCLYVISTSLCCWVRMNVIVKSVRHRVIFAVIMLDVLLTHFQINRAIRIHVLIFCKTAPIGRLFMIYLPFDLNRTNCFIKLISINLFYRMSFIFSRCWLIINRLHSFGIWSGAHFGRRS